MQLNIIDNCKIELSKTLKNIIYIDESLQNKNSLKFYIEKDKQNIRKEISLLIKDDLSKKFKKILKKKEDYLIWEMSSIFELNTLRTNSFYKLAQIICIKNLIKKNKIKKINYYGSNRYILDFLEKSKISVNYFYRPAIKSKFKKFYFLRGLAFFIKYIFTNFNLIISNISKVKSDKNFIFISYLVHLNKKSDKIFFASNHWGDIPITVNKLGKKIDWYYDYTPSHELPNYRQANKFLKSFSNDKNNHSFLSANLGILNCIKVLLRFFYLSLQFHLIYKNNKISTNKLNNFNLLEIFEKEYAESFYGTLLISNLFYIEIYKNFFKKINKNKNKNIFFLLENQPWEKAFLYFSKKLKNIKIYGCVNSTTIFWDMRYYHHDKLENFKNISRILINGNLAKNYLKDCVDIKKLKKVEAIRYKYLLEYKNNHKKRNKKILVLGEQSIPTTLSCLDYLNSIKNDKYYKFDFKPHPTTASNIVNYIQKKYKNIKLVKNNSRDIYKSYRYTIVIGSTSAIIEAIYFQTKVLVYDKNDNFFLCPLFNDKKARIIDENETITHNLKNNLLTIHSNELNNIAFIERENKNWLSFLKNIKR